jgi:hypothetical protein
MLKHARCNHQALIKLMRASKNPLLAGIKKAGLLVPQDDVFGRTVRPKTSAAKNIMKIKKFENYFSFLRITH